MEFRQLDPRLNALALVALLVLLTMLFFSHARAQAPPQCFDELLVRWNEFAQDANRHIQTNEAKRADHDRAHDKLDREWQAVRALACW